MRRKPYHALPACFQPARSSACTPRNLPAADARRPDPRGPGRVIPAHANHRFAWALAVDKPLRGLSTVSYVVKMTFFRIRGPPQRKRSNPGYPRGLPRGVERSERAFVLRAKMSGAKFAPTSRQTGIGSGGLCPSHSLHLSFFDRPAHANHRYAWAFSLVGRRGSCHGLCPDRAHSFRKRRPRPALPRSAAGGCISRSAPTGRGPRS